LTNFSSDYQTTLPAPTSIEAILQPHSDAVPDAADTDPRLASAKHWTTVTSNTRLIVSILTSWVDREYSYYHYLDLEAFLDSMESGSSDYCSPLLVNALLASACVSLLAFASHRRRYAVPSWMIGFLQCTQSTSSAVKDRSKPFSEGSIMTAFYKEAVRLWDLEAGRSSLTTIHAGICLCKLTRLILIPRLSSRGGDILPLSTAKWA
jgi:hypothetical protein